MGIVIAHGVPVYDSVEFKTFTSIVALHGEWRRHLPFCDALAPVFCSTQPVHSARERIAEVAFEHAHAEVLLFQDADVSVEPEQVALLLKTLLDSSPKVGLVGAPCVMRTRDRTAAGKMAPFGDNVWPLKDERGVAYGARTDNPWTCAAIGFGLVAIRRSVFQRLPRPWFRFEADDAGVLRVGEDVGFCDRIRQNYGFEIVCEPRVRPLHHFRVGLGFGSPHRELAEHLSESE